MNLGTILPTRESLYVGDKAADKFRKSLELKGEKLLGSYDKRVVGGETRYYDGNRYAIVNRHGDVCWFEVRPDGDYRITNYGK